MTQVIEIVVIGPVGSGKSHVMEVLARALRAQYGIHAQTTSHELSLEKNLGNEPTKPRIADTIFNVREHGDVNFAEIAARRTHPKLDTPAATAAVQGEALSFMLDPLEQAIESTARVLRDEQEHTSPGSPVYYRLNEHLDALLAAQLARVSRHE